MEAPHDFLTLLDTLQTRQITLSVVGETAAPGTPLNLKIQAPKGAVDAPLQAAIKHHKQALIAQFRSLQPQLASAIQQRLWLLQQLEPDSARYHESTYLALQGDVPAPEALAQALRQVQNRHLALRMGFSRQEGRVYCTFNRPANHTLVLALSEDPVAFIRRPFDLTAGSLFRACWYPESQRLLLVFHHLIADAASGSLLMHDLLRSLQGDEGEMMPCVHPAFQSDYPPSAAPETSPLKAHSPFIDDMPRKPLMDSETPDTAEACTLPLPDTLREQIYAQAKAQGVTPFSWFLSAWQHFIAAYWRLRTPFVATPLTERHHPQFAEFQPVGSLINTFLAAPPVLEAAHQPPFVEQVRLQQAAIYNALADGFDFAQVVQSLDIPRHLPFFPPLGVVTQPVITDLQWGALRVERLPLPWLPAKFEVLLTWFQSPETQSARDHLELAWPTGWYTASQMRTLLQHFLFFWQHTLENPHHTLSQIPLMPPETRRALLESDPPAELPSHPLSDLAPAASPANTLLHGRVEYFAQHTPTAPALQYPGEPPLDYAQLNAYANQYAQRLVEAGVGVGDVVLVELPVSYALIITLVAVLKVGAAYLPLVPDAPPLRRQLILKAAQPGCIVDAEWLATKVTPMLPPVHKLLQDPASRNLQRAIHADHLAYIIFTSGSTGEPKGVPITHGNSVRLFPAVAQHMDFAPDEVWLLFHSIAFDFSVWELWGAFYGGARLVLMPPAPVYRPEAVWELIFRYGVTQLSQTPSAFLSLSASLASAEGLRILPLKRVILSGEKLSLSALRPWWQQRGETVELVNAYGITETTVFVTWCVLTPTVRQAAEAAGQESPIGSALLDLGLALQDPQGEPVPEGVPGELRVTGAGVSAPFGPVYRTGDQAVRVENALYYLQRLDQQVQLRGHRVECREVERALLDLPAITQAHVFLWNDRLMAVVCHAEAPEQEVLWKQRLRQRLPEVMIPARIFMRPHFPLTTNGKQDLPALEASLKAELSTPVLSETSAQPATASQEALWQRLLPILQRVLQRESIPLETSFFDLGAHSLLLLELQRAVEVELERTLDPVLLFRYPTPGQLLNYLSLSPQDLQDGPKRQGPQASPKASPKADPQPNASLHGPALHSPIAVIGMSLRFPGAESVAAYWELLKTGASGLEHWDTETLLHQGESPALFKDPHYVPVSGWIADTYAFDARYFGISDADAQILDPQQRVMLTLAHEALEHGGYPALGTAQHTGVFVSSGISRYLLESLLPRFQQEPSSYAPMQLLVANDKDYLPTRIAYHLNLTGPALSIQSACSSSLAALHLACASLRRGECNQALAGGVNLDTRPRGYLYQEGGIYSASGQCAPFDASATGIVGGSGGGWVLLKPLDQALADGDTVYGVIEGSMLNNDGANKVGYFAPGVQGQVRVVTEALQAAHCHPRDIGYIEAHGTGTRLGDPIEVAALQSVWAADPDSVTFLGSVKGNIGHLDAAAGIASVIKVILMLHYRQRVPTLNFQHANPALGLDSSPFRIAQTTEPWEYKRRAGISSLGVGGTNGHVICAAAPPLPQTPPQTPAARSSFLDASLAASLAASLSTSPSVMLPFSLPHPRLLSQWIKALKATVGTVTPPMSPAEELLLLQHWASTLEGRKTYAYRLPVVASSTAELFRQFELESFSEAFEAKVDPPAVVFLCPGLGSQSALELVEALRAPVFALHFRQCCTLLKALTESVVKPKTLTLFERLEAFASVPFDPREHTEHTAALDALERDLCDPQAMQLSIFIMGWCLAQRWKAVGVTPQYMVGHSFGECLAMALAGWVSLEDALRWVSLRGAAFALLPPQDGVLAVAANPEALPLDAWPELFLATHNRDDRCVITGARSALDRFAAHLKYKSTEAPVITRLLPIPHGVHYPALATPSLKEALQVSTAHFQATPPTEPAPKVWSCRRQAWHGGAPEVHYWQSQATEPLDFRPAVLAISALPAAVLIELSGTPHLTGLFQGDHLYPGLRKSHPDFLSQCAAVWRAGLSLSRTALLQSPLTHGEKPQANPARRPALPPTPLNAQTYRLWPPATSPAPTLVNSEQTQTKSSPTPPHVPIEPAMPLQMKQWRPVSQLLLRAEKARQHLADNSVFALAVNEALPPPEILEASQALVIQVPDFITPDTYDAMLAYLEDCRQCMMALAARSWQGVLIWRVPAFSALPLTDFAAGSLASSSSASSADAFPLLTLQPLQGLLEAFLQTLPLTYPGWRVILQAFYCASQDLVSHPLPLPPLGSPGISFQHRVWVPSTVAPHWTVWAAELSDAPATALLEALPPVLRHGGVYVFTGATGGIATVLARYLQTHYQARLVLLSRQPEAIDAAVLAGGEVLPLKTEVTQSSALTQALHSAFQHFGALHGVIHTAGTTASQSLAQSSPAFLRQALAPKVEGLMALTEALQRLSMGTDSGEPLPLPDFVALCSAPETRLDLQSGEQHGATQWAYQAGNRFCDAWCAAAPLPTQWVSLRWGHWRETGMAYRLQSHLPPAFAAGYARYLAQGIGNAEAGMLWAESLKLMAACVEIKVLPQDALQKLWQETFSDALQESLPVAEREEAIASLWLRYLGRKPQAGERFSDLGGDSLAALQLKSALENELRLAVPLPLLLQDLPFAEFVQAFQTPVEKSAPAPILTTPLHALPLEVLVPLNRASRLPTPQAPTPRTEALSSVPIASPLFFVHAISGTVFPFQHLAQALNRPLVGIQSVGLLSPQAQSRASQAQAGELPTDIEAIAAVYCAVIESRYPPPYTVGGWSFGALVAFAMARHWHERDVPVAELVLLDMEPPDTRTWTPDMLRAHFEADLARVWPEGGQNGVGHAGLSEAQQQFKQRLAAIFEAHAQATLSFCLSPLAVPSRLLVAEAGLVQEHAHSRWSEVLSPLQTHIIPGDHYTCLAPEHVSQWAHYLEAKSASET